jgi:DivIVA domain-containing protein
MRLRAANSAMSARPVKELSVNDFDRPGAALDEPATRRSAGSRLAELGDRLSRTFGSSDRVKPEVPSWDADGEADGDLEYAVDDTVEIAEPFEERRFPIAPQGYDREAVDEYLAELERELAEQRAGEHSERSVAAEIERIGEQTSAILLVAHDKAQETMHQAQEQADRCVADAASNAVAITEEATRRLRQLDSETDSVWRERARLIDDVRHVSSALASLAQEASDRFPAEPDRTETQDPAPVRPVYGWQDRLSPEDV